MQKQTLKQVENQVVNAIGFTPTFLNLDLGKFTGCIIIVQEWPDPPYTLQTMGLPPANNLPNHVWDGISKIDEGLSDILQSDITDLSVSFDGSIHTDKPSYRFTINFIYG